MVAEESLLFADDAMVSFGGFLYESDVLIKFFL